MSRSRRRRALVVTSIAALVGFVAFVQATNGPSTRRVEVASTVAVPRSRYAVGRPGRPLQPVPAPTSTTQISTAPQRDGASRPVTASQSRRPPSPTTTSTAPIVCRDSTDPICGPAYWAPMPHDEPPVIVSVTVSPRTPIAGKPFTLTISWRDADSPFGEVSGACIVGGSCWRISAVSVVAPEAHGPWTPPPTGPGSGTTSETLTVATPGAAHWVAYVHTYSTLEPLHSPLSDPHAAEIHQEGSLHVVAAGAGATTAPPQTPTTTTTFASD